jgi:hypothetical protein
MCSAKWHVRFTPNSDRKSRHAAQVMSALPPKADMCDATSNVGFGPKADILTLELDIVWDVTNFHNDYGSKREIGKNADETHRAKTKDIK